MSEVFFIGDTHFGHKGILKFSARARNEGIIK
jgi:calcineurin-like phosphoesterase family protein